MPGTQRSGDVTCHFYYCYYYYWASLVAQRLKHLPTMRETQVQSLGWKDLLEKGMATHPSILADPLAKKRLKEIFLASLVA